MSRAYSPTATIGCGPTKPSTPERRKNVHFRPAFLSDNGNVIARDTTLLVVAVGVVFILVQVLVPTIFFNELPVPSAFEPFPSPVGTNGDQGGGATRGTRWDGGLQRVLPEAMHLCKHSNFRSSFSTAWEKGTSNVKWCEGKYQVSEYVAEFYNTGSNIAFFVLPPLAAFLFRHYSIKIDAGINVVWGLLMVVGAGSGYFHATLSLSGQLFDEWAIVWVVLAGLALWTPPALYPTSHRQLEKWFGIRSSSDRRTTFKLSMFALAIILTCLTMVYPVANAFVMFAFILPVFKILQHEHDFHKFKTSLDPRHRTVARLAAASLCWMLLAVVCWINDRLFCDWWRSLGIPYPQLHAWWHVFVLIASYTMCVVAAWTYAERVVPEYLPVIEYWPFHGAGLPFVQIDMDVVSIMKRRRRHNVERRIRL